MERRHGDHERFYEESNFSNQEDPISQQHTCGNEMNRALGHLCAHIG